LTSPTLDLRCRNKQHLSVRLRPLRASLFAFGLVALGMALVWKGRTTDGYRVIAQDSQYSITSFKVSRGHDHDMWDANPGEITFSRWLGSTAFTRRFRFKLVSPISWFRTRTADPSLAFIVRLKGEMSDRELAGLTAQLVSGTNEYELTALASARNFGRQSLIKCWVMPSAPPTNTPLDLHIRFGTGASLARIAIPTDRPEFARPLVAPNEIKSNIAGVLKSFLRDEKTAPDTLNLLHELYEEYHAPDFLAVFEMIYYDPDGSASGDSALSLNARLRSTADEWLKQAAITSAPE
jgi:hypothetical protein